MNITYHLLMKIKFKKRPILLKTVLTRSSLWIGIALVSLSIGSSPTLADDHDKDSSKKLFITGLTFFQNLEKKTDSCKGPRPIYLSPYTSRIIKKGLNQSCQMRHGDFEISHLIDDSQSNIEIAESFLNQNSQNSVSIAETQYEGPKSQDFKNRGDLILLALESLLKKRKKNWSNEANQNLEQLKKRHRERPYTLTPPSKDYKKMGQNDWKNYYENSFKKEYGTNRKELKDLALASLAMAQKHIDSKIKAKDLFDEENKIITEKGRPNLIHFYQVGNVKVASIQQNWNDNKTPIMTSAIRNQKGNSNPAIRSVAIIDSSENNKLINIKNIFSAKTHTSYPPIGIRDDFERQKTTLSHNVPESLRLAVREYKKNHQGKCPEKPLTHNSMMLLSPMPLDKYYLRKKSEQKQVEESYYSLMAYNGVSFPSIEGCSHVSFQMRAMNVGANVISSFLPINNFANGINAQGQLELDKDYFERMDKKINQNALQCLLNNDKMMEATKVIDSIKGKIKEIMEIPSNHPLFKEISFLKNQLKDKYRFMRKAVEENNKKDYQKILKEISSLELKSLEKSKQLISLKKEKYLKNKNRLEELRQLLGKITADIVQNIKGDDPDKEKVQQYFEKQKDLTDLMVDSWHLYFGQKINSGSLSHVPLIKKTQLMYGIDFNTRYQRNYLIMNRLMGHDVEYYCKSGEDRTGRMANGIEENIIFKAMKGHYPSSLSKQDNQILREEIAPTVHNSSVAAEITHYNAYGARGLQIQGQVNREIYYESKMANSMAHLAKEIWNK